MSVRVFGVCSIALDDACACGDGVTVSQSQARRLSAVRAADELRHARDMARLEAVQASTAAAQREAAALRIQSQARRVIAAVVFVGGIAPSQYTVPPSTLTTAVHSSYNWQFVCLLSMLLSRLLPENLLDSTQAEY